MHLLSKKIFFSSLSLHANKLMDKVGSPGLPGLRPCEWGLSCLDFRDVISFQVHVGEFSIPQVIVYLPGLVYLHPNMRKISMSFITLFSKKFNCKHIFNTVSQVSVAKASLELCLC